MKSILKEGPLGSYVWYIMKLEKAEDGKQYVAIDCNHRLVAYQRMKLKTASCLVFPPLKKETYNAIASTFLLFVYLTFHRNC
jgi:hypothetical protein